MASKRAKLMAQRDRERRARENLLLDEELASNLKRMKAEVGGFARPGSKIAKGTKQALALKDQLQRFGPRFTTDFRGLARADPSPKVEQAPRYEGAMAEREAKAVEEAKFLKNRVGPLGNKMGDQYMTDTDLADFQKGLLRRRS